MTKNYRHVFIFSILNLFITTHSIAQSTTQSPAQPTISGISSGAFMAVQMVTIFSSQFSGVGTVAGGFFYCAQNHMQEKIKEGQLTLLGSKNLFLYNNTNIISPNTAQWFEPAPANPIYQSVAVCMHDPKSATRPDLVQFEKEKKITSLNNFQNLKAYIYQGEFDTVVHKEMAQQMISFYNENKIPAENIKLSPGEGGHNFPTDKENLNSCLAEKVPYISSCNKDVAKEILEQTTNTTYVKSEPVKDRIFMLDQNLDFKNQKIAEKDWVQPAPSLAPYSYLYASQKCLQSPASCHLHVALHGCEMSDSFNKDFDESYAEQVSKYQNLSMRKKSTLFANVLDLPYIEQKTNKYGALKFVLNAGYIDYAEKNNLMILFPQTWITENNYPYNPKGCWDWFGWTGSNYASIQGQETAWLSKYINAVSQNPTQFILRQKPHFELLKDEK